jgi:hypothetical protein
MTKRPSPFVESIQTNALADAAVENRRLAAKIAMLERSIERRDEADAEARSTKRAESIFSETAADLAARPPRAPAIDADAVHKILSRGPDAQALAGLIVAAGRKARGEVDPGLYFGEGTTAEEKQFAISVCNAGRKRRGLPPLCETDETGDEPVPQRLPDIEDTSDPHDDADFEIDENGKLRKVKKRI